MVETITEKGFAKWETDNVSTTLRYSGGSYGGGSEVLVIERSNDDDGRKQEKA